MKSKVSVSWVGNKSEEVAFFVKNDDNDVFFEKEKKNE